MTQTEDLAQFDPASFEHIPVLLNECLDRLNIDPAGTYLDGTAGGAGHSRQIALRLDGTKGGRLVSLDQDPDAVQTARARLAGLPATVVQINFRYAGQALESLGIEKINGALLDLGADRRPQRGGPRDGPHRDDFAAGRHRGQRHAACGAAQEQESFAAHVSGAAYRGQPRAGRSGGRSGYHLRPPCPGRKAVCDHLPFAGGPAGEKQVPPLVHRLHLPAGVPGLRLRRQGEGKAHYPEAHRGRQAGTGGEPAQPFCSSARFGETLSRIRCRSV